MTRPGQGTAGYNEFLVKMGDSIKRMAAERQLAVVDLNAAMVAALTSARAKDPVMATMLIGDHVHPGPGMHWVIADEMLKAWNASPVVSSVALSGSRGTVLSSANSMVTEGEGLRRSAVLGAVGPGAAAADGRDGVCDRPRAALVKCRPGPRPGDADGERPA